MYGLAYVMCVICMFSACVSFLSFVLFYFFNGEEMYIVIITDMFNVA